MTDSHPGELDPTLTAWVEDTMHGTVTRCVRTPSGGSRHSYFLDVERGDREQVGAVLRVEAGGSFTGTEINVVKEAAAYRALSGSEVPVPAVLGLAPGGAAVLLELIPGRSDLGDTPEEQAATLGAFMRVVGDLHTLDTNRLDLPGFERPRTPEDHAVLDIRMWRRLGDLIPGLDPLIRYAGSYLVAHPPSTVFRTCFVQGDTGPGNFLAEEGRVTGLCDMEFAHIGDPMDDVAWVLVRAGRLVTDMAPYLIEYSERSGIPILQPNLDFYGVAVQYRCAVTTSLAVARGGGARGWPPYLLVTQRYLRDLAERLSSYLEIPDPPVPAPDHAASPRASWYDALLDGIRQGVRGIPEVGLREQTRNHQILVHYLRAYDQMGARLDEMDAADAHQTLGVDPGDHQARGRLAEDAGAAGDTLVLSYLLRRRRRQAMLWQSVLDRRR